MNEYSLFPELQLNFSEGQFELSRDLMREFKATNLQLDPSW